MADRKPGVVKPPVIDLTARPADPAPPAADKPAPAEVAPPAAPGPDTAARPAPEKSKTAPEKAAKTGAERPESKPAAAATAAAAPGEAARPAPPPRRRSRWLPAGIGVIGGAVLGIAASYGIATLGYWPSVPDSRIDDLTQRLTQLEQTGASNGTALADLDARFRSLGGDVAAKLAAASDAVAKLQQETGKTDLGPLSAEVKTLGARLDAVAAGASSADAGALAANLATVQRDLAGLNDKLAAVDAHLTHTDSDVAGLGSTLAAAKAEIDKAAAAPSSATVAAAVRLPLLISALEADLAAGRPYADDLQRLAAAAPATRVPASLADAAAAGLPAPEAFTAAFEAKMPDLLAALPGGTDSSWQGRADDWLRGILALRTQGEQAGNSPAAILSRLEAAVLRHDYASAAPLFDQLPQAVKDAAGTLGARLHALADADGFVAALRQTALSPAGSAS